MVSAHSDVAVLPAPPDGGHGRWIALNAFARSALGVSSSVLAVLGGEEPEGPFTIWHIDRFSNEDGLSADPSRFERRPQMWRREDVDLAALLNVLHKHFLVVDDETVYRKRFADKTNVLDNAHFGSFHQQLGSHMLLNRTDPEQWWVEQKFTDSSGTTVRPDSLYGAVQASRLERYFQSRVRPGMRALDLGCGTGVYSRMMAAAGADVLGVDPNAAYLERGVETQHASLRFQQMHPGVPGGLDGLDDSSFDLVFMSDALLFYFRPYYPGQQADISVLLADIRRILKPAGSFVSVEPHSVFYLAPWLGSTDRPFTILTEYLHKSYGIVPPLSWLFGHLEAAGFAVTSFQELTPNTISPRSSLSGS
jgi:SAM-dependent methyltransferase